MSTTSKIYYKAIRIAEFSNNYIIFIRLVYINTIGDTIKHHQESVLLIN